MGANFTSRLILLLIFLGMLGYSCLHMTRKSAAEGYIRESNSLGKQDVDSTNNRQVEFIQTAGSENTSATNSSIPSSISIQILMVIGKDTKHEYYKHAFDSVRCYTQIQNYSFLLVVDTDYSIQCPHKDKFFRRHCVTAHLLHLADFTLFIDADIGVVNPKRRIEEFIDHRFDITFYDRFYNQEVMAGAYLVKNSEWSRTFLRGWADFEYRLPQSFHGTDNGAIHAYLAFVIFPDRQKYYSKCLQLYKISNGYADLFAFEACIRSIMGISEEFGRIRILRKGKGWARDNWLTNSKWNPERDFMVHGWKLNQLTTYTQKQLPLTIQESSQSSWFNPLAGSIDLSKCHPQNYSWFYDPNLIATVDAIGEKLGKMFEETEKSRYKSLSLVAQRLNL